jgi:hypothetical protein
MESFKNRLKKQIYRSLYEENEVENIHNMIKSHGIRLNSMAIGPHINRADEYDEGGSPAMKLFWDTHRGQLRNDDTDLAKAAYVVHDASIRSSDEELKRSLHDMSTKIIDNHLNHLTGRVDPNHPIIRRAIERDNIIRSQI